LIDTAIRFNVRPFGLFCIHVDQGCVYVVTDGTTVYV